MNEKRVAYSINVFMVVLARLKLAKFKGFNLASIKLANKYQRRSGRKPRTTSKDMCCDNLGCDPMWPETPAKKKIAKRMKLGLCRGCGNKPAECRCRRKSK